MIIDLIQTRNDISAEYRFYRKGVALASAEAPFAFLKSTIELDFSGQIKYVLRLDFIEKIKSNYKQPVNQRLEPFIINDQCGIVIGCIQGKITKNFFGKLYYDVIFQGSSYKGYRIGLGQKGLFIDLFEDETLICSIHKDSAVYDNKDSYHAYIHEERYLDLACLFMLYYDYCEGVNHMNASYKKTESKTVFTLNKKTRNLHDQDFIDSCQP